MSKTDLIDEGRRQGFLTAYKVVKQAAEEGKDPVAVLKAELDYRKITKIMIPVTKKELDLAGERYKENAVNSCSALAMVTLWDTFHFGKVRNERFLDAYKRNTDAFFEGYLTWEDVIETLDKKCDMRIDLSDDLAMRR